MEQWWSNDTMGAVAPSHRMLTIFRSGKENVKRDYVSKSADRRKEQ